MKIKVRGIEYEVPPEVGNYITETETSIATDSSKAATALETMTKRAEKAETDLGIEKAAHKKTQTALDAAPADIKAKLSARDALNKKAAKYLDKTKMTELDAADDVSVMKAALLADNPDCELDGKDESYIRGQFDGLKGPVGGGDSEQEFDETDPREAALARQRETVTGGDRRQDRGERETARDSRPRGRGRMLERNRGIYRAKVDA